MPELHKQREFQLPGRRRARWWIWAFAALVHLPLAFLVFRKVVIPDNLLESRQVVLNDAAHDMRLSSPRGRPPLSVAPPSAPIRKSGVSMPPAATVAPVAPVTLAPRVPAAPVEGSVAGGAGLRPHYGDGRLWMQPLPESPQAIAKLMAGKDGKQLADSAVTAMIQTYLNQMAAEEHPEVLNALPSWTTKINGKTVGIDSKWIYIGPLKVPTFLLSLLPIMRTGNPTQAEFTAKLQQMRADIFDAARRSQNYQDFKRAILDAHEQSERAREFKKNQSIAPDTSHHT